MPGNLRLIHAKPGYGFATSYEKNSVGLKMPGDNSSSTGSSAGQAQASVHDLA
jgi:hypothetical protein